MVGKRHDLALERELDFCDPRVIENVKARAVKEGRLQGPWWIDYFLYTKGLFKNIPPFFVGCWRWDNWMINKALSAGASVIDATRVVTAIHQDHDSAEHRSIKYVMPRTEKIFTINSELYEKYSFFDPQCNVPGSTEYSTHILTERGLIIKESSIKERIKMFLILEPYRWPHMKGLCELFYILGEKLNLLSRRQRAP